MTRHRIGNPSRPETPTSTQDATGEDNAGSSPDGEDWHCGRSSCHIGTSKCSSFLTMASGTLSRHHQRSQEPAQRQCQLLRAMREPPGPAPQGQKAWRSPRRTTVPNPANRLSPGPRGVGATDCLRPRRLLAGLETRRGRWDLGGRSQRHVAQLPPVSPCAVEATRTQTLGRPAGCHITMTRCHATLT